MFCTLILLFIPYSPPPPSALDTGAAAAKRWRGLMEGGSKAKMEVVADPFWTYPHAYRCSERENKKRWKFGEIALLYYYSAQRDEGCLSRPVPLVVRGKASDIQGEVLLTDPI